jgi:hypothetical protein
MLEMLDIPHNTTILGRFTIEHSQADSDENLSDGEKKVAFHHPSRHKADESENKNSMPKNVGRGQAHI